MGILATQGTQVDRRENSLTAPAPGRPLLECAVELTGTPMAGPPLRTVVPHPRRVADAGAAAAPTDAQLLGRFADAGAPAAFELLLWRQGAMVFGLCRRVARHEQDAEDAFQA